MKNLYQLLSKTAGIFLFLFVLGVSVVSAQDRRVTGTIRDADGSLPGATVAQKGTKNGTVTDVNGAYSLMVSGQNPVLVVSYTGFETQELAIGSQSTAEFVLSSADAIISDVVVTGYTVDTRRQTTSAVATVKTRDLAAVPSGNVEQQLQGRVSGVTVITNGQPGTASLVRIRGFGSFGGNQPLYVVDGVATQDISFLSPDDIDNTTVLKDASSASIYGARAAAGVIVITTKKGTKKQQKMQVSYDGLMGSTNPGHGQEILNPQETADWTWNAIRNTAAATGEQPVFNHPQYGSGQTPVLPDFINVGGLSGLNASQVNLEEEKRKYNVNAANGGIYQVVRANKEGTDWYKAITRQAPMMRHNLGFTGSTENARFYLGLNVQDQSGILKYNEFKRYGIRANTEFSIGKRLRVGENFQFTYGKVLGLIGGGNGANSSQEENVILEAFRIPSIIPVYDEYGGYAGTAAKAFNNPRNPVAQRDGIKNNNGYSTRTFGNVYGELDLMKDLTFRSSVGGNIGNYSGFGYNRASYENSENNSSFTYNEFGGNSFDWVLTNTLQMKKQFDSHKLEVLLGQEALKTGAGRGFSASGLDPFSTDPDYITINTVSNKNVFSYNAVPTTYSSVFGRAHYSLMDKYYLTGVIRRDGSSKFGSSTRYGVFPGVSAAWRVSGEEFMKGINWLEDFKIRAGWGQMGNDNNVTPTNQYSLFASSLGDASYPIGGGNTGTAEGFFQSQVGNPNAKWETSTTSNIGFEGLAFSGKWDIIVDLWKKKTDDLLFQVPLSQVLGGFAAAPSQNVASMENKGIDLQLVNKGRIAGNTRYEATLTGTWLKNEITKVADKFNYFDASSSSNRLAGNMIRNQVGHSISAFYGYKVVGIFNSSNLVHDTVQTGAGVGRFKYADLNSYDAAGKLTGKPDGKIDAADRTFIGSPVPKFTGGLNLKLIFGQFDVETYMYTSMGNDIFNLSKWYTDFYPSFTGAAISTRVKDSWSTANQGSQNPIFENVSNFSTNTQANSWYVEDGSYFRIQNLTIGYNLPKELMNKWNVSRARIYAATNNLFTATKYKGLDPAVGGAADTSLGIDIGNYPVTRSVMVGLGLTF